jgi:hypothetical protein
MAKQAQKMPMKSKPATRPPADGGPPKHLAYITEEEAKLLDIILTIKKGAKGKDGKPLPQTYSPGGGHPLEFLTELTAAQINELLGKTDGESETTPQGVESYAMFSENSSTTAGKTSAQKDASYGGSKSTKDSNSGYASSQFNNNTRSPSKSDVGAKGRTADSGNSNSSYFGGINTNTVRTSQPKSSQMQETERRYEVGRVRDQMSQYRSPPGTEATALDPSLRGRAQAAGRSKLSGLVSGPGKTDRESISRPLGSSIPNTSELGRLVSAPGKTDRANVTTLNRDPTGPVPKRTTDTASELANLSVGSRFNRPLADDPGAYDESEMANAVTGEKPRPLGGGFKKFNEGVQTDPTSDKLADSSLQMLTGGKPSPQPVSAPGKSDRQVPLQSAPGKTDRVRDIIMGAGPIPKSNVLPFRNGVPDSTLSPLVTQKPPPANDDLITSPSPEERRLMPSLPVPAPSPVSRSSLQGLTTAPDTSGSGEFIDPEMPDISFDNNQPSGSLFDPVPESPDPGTEGGGEPLPIDTGNPPAPGPGPGPAPEPEPSAGAEGSAEYLPGIMPWDRADYEEIAKAYEAAGQTYTPQQFMAAFYNSQPFTIERPAADPDVPAPADASIDPYGGIMPWDRLAYEKLRKSAEAVGQTYTPQQFIAQFYKQAA